MLTDFLTLRPTYTQPGANGLARAFHNTIQYVASAHFFFPVHEVRIHLAEENSTLRYHKVSSNLGRLVHGGLALAAIALGFKYIRQMSFVVAGLLSAKFVSNFLMRKDVVISNSELVVISNSEVVELGRKYIRGITRSQNLAKAEALFKYALEAAQGKDERNEAIGRLLDLGSAYQNGQEAMHGQAAIAQDLAKAEELFKYALEAAQGEDERAAAIRGLFGLGSVYQNGQEAMHGQAAIAQDLSKAEELFKYALEKATGEEERAAAIGRLLDLGYVYQNGQEAMHGQAAIAQDLAKAEALLRYVADHAGSSPDQKSAVFGALVELGRAYQYGEEAMHGQAAIAQDLAKAEELFKYALEKATGEEERAAAIGRLLDLGVYQNGQEAMHGQAAIPQNLSKAGELYALAKGYGSEEATELLRRLSQEWYRWSCTKSSKSRR
ncbi:MAG: hypothetical protein K940chlam8_00828 [Chlamydiae bacterium]|nr:hypothetical protein [Chlamydiota bacterium]